MCLLGLKKHFRNGRGLVYMHETTKCGVINNFSFHESL